MYEKLVLVVRQTRLQALEARYGTRGQVKFSFEHAGLDFNEYLQEHETYTRARKSVIAQLETFDVPLQILDRTLVDTYAFLNTDLVLALGQNGLVANCAKYVKAPLIGVNSDSLRNDSVLLPFTPADVTRVVSACFGTAGSAMTRLVTLAHVALSDGQELNAFNDLFIGQATHASARYRLSQAKRSEEQSSSGVIVATGVGSTGWLSSVFNGAAGVERFSQRNCTPGVQLPWEDERLLYVVREPFVSKHSQATLVMGYVDTAHPLQIESQMAENGVIFSDGMESDRLHFDAGVLATITPAAFKAQLVVGVGQ